MFESIVSLLQALFAVFQGVEFATFLQALFGLLK